MPDIRDLTASQWQELVDALERELEKTRSHLELTQLVALLLFFALMTVLAID